MGLPWDCHGTAMELLWDCFGTATYGTAVGLLWHCYGAAMPILRASMLVGMGVAMGSHFGCMGVGMGLYTVRVRCYGVVVGLYMGLLWAWYVSGLSAASL